MESWTWLPSCNIRGWHPLCLRECETRLPLLLVHRHPSILCYNSSSLLCTGKSWDHLSLQRLQNHLLSPERRLLLVLQKPVLVRAQALRSSEGGTGHLPVPPLHCCEGMCFSDSFPSVSPCNFPEGSVEFLPVEPSSSGRHSAFECLQG